MKSVHFIKRKNVQLAAMYAGLLLFFLATDPKKLSVGLLLVPFIWLFIVLFLTFRLLFERHNTNVSGVGQRKTWVRAAILALLPTFLLLLDSINQLTVRDGFIFIGFVALGIFYANKLTFNPAT